MAEDVDQIIRDLVEASIALTRKRKAEAFTPKRPERPRRES